MSLSRTRPRMTGEVHRTFIEWFSSSSYWQAKTATDPRITLAKVQESLSTDVFEPPTSTGSLCSSFSTFSCLTNELPIYHFSIYDLIFSTKSELYRSKRRSFDFRLTSVVQKRLCLSSLILTFYDEIMRVELYTSGPHSRFRLMIRWIFVSNHQFFVAV